MTRREVRAELTGFEVLGYATEVDEKYEGKTAIEFVVDRDAAKGLRLGTVFTMTLDDGELDL